MKIIKYLLLIILAISLNISCDDGICTSNTESFLDTEFIINDENLLANNFVDSMSVYSPEWTDSIHYSEEGSENILSFILSPTDLSTTIILTSKQEALKDTIQIFHQSEMYFLSPECGFTLDYEIDSIISSDNLIDSILIVTSTITNDENGLVQIYL